MRETKSSVPAVIDARAKLTPVHAAALGSIGDGRSERPSMPLSQHLWIIRRDCWKILLFVAVCALVTFVFSRQLTPVYKSTATIDVDLQPAQGMMEQASQPQRLEDTDKFLATQMKLIQSDAVLRPVALKYSLLSRERQDQDAMKRRRVEGAEAPVFLKKLKVARSPNTYLLQISYSSTDPHLAAYVANAVAASYIEHTYDIRIRAAAGFSSFIEKQLQGLKARMEKSSLAVARFERDTNLINPDEKTSILSARLSQLNTEYTKAQADRVAKEPEYNSVKTGSFEAAEVANQGPALRLLAARLNEANEKFAGVKAKFGANRTEYKRAAAVVAQLTKRLDRTRRYIAKRVQMEYFRAAGRERLLGRKVAATKAEFDRLYASSSEYKSLRREADADQRSYQEMLQKVRETGTNASFQDNAIRLADSARPTHRPVSPNIQLNVLLACLLAGILGITVAIVTEAMNDTVRDPEQAHTLFNADVIGILPIARSRGGLLASRKNKSGALMRWQDPNDRRVTAYVEAIRTLRNSITLSNMNHRLKSILMTSAGPREGKSTTAVHLALAHAEQRHRTLLIDCDLRTSSIHRYFDISNSVGVSNVVTEGMPWRDAVARVDGTPELHLLLSGRLTQTAADLVGREIASIIAEAEKEYDLVVVDAPPMLGFAEAVQIATHVNGVVVVTVAGQTNRRAVVDLLHTLSRMRIDVAGIVLNKLAANANSGYRLHGNYSRDAHLKQR